MQTRLFFTALTLACLLAPMATAALKLPAVFSDHAVLQQGIPLKIWGWADPGSQVTVQLTGIEPWRADQPALPESLSAQAKTNADGRFTATLSAVPGAGKATLKVISGDETLTRQDLLIGEVYFCSGQSNMQWLMKNNPAYKPDIAAANHPGLRFFKAPNVASAEPQPDIKGGWAAITPDNAGTSSAVAYWFGKRLHEQTDTPVGLIQSAWGGTSAEAWTRFESLASHPATKGITDRASHLRGTPDPRPKYHTDTRITDQEIAQRAAHDVDHSKWQTRPMPLEHTDIYGDLDGVLWLRTAVDLPAGWVNKNVTLNLGPTAHEDQTFVNGQKVGGFQNAGDEPELRRYTVPATVNKTAKMTIAIRIFDRGLRGGFVGEKEDVYLQLGDEKISLAKRWGFVIQQHRSSNNLKGQPLAEHRMPGTLYNAMVNPFAGYTMRGAIWYQGESNVGSAEQYKIILPTMINDWRKAWNQPTGSYDFGFGIVELATYKDAAKSPNGSSLADLRGAQQFTANTVPNTGIITTIDAGDAYDIHPVNKRPVGERLAAWAMATQWPKMDIVYQSPEIAAVRYEGAKIIIEIDPNDPAGLKDWPTPIAGFAIADDDNQWQWAQTQVIGPNTLSLEHSQITSPTQLRYGWNSNPWDGPNGCRIINQSGWPMAPAQAHKNQND